MVKTGAPRGRPPAPVALTSLRTGRRAPRLGPVSVSAVAPPGMSTEAVSFWDRVAPSLVASGVLATDGDVEVFVQLSEVHAGITRVRREIARDGDIIEGRQGAPVRHPGYTVLGSLLPLFAQLAGQFGMTPVARGRLARTDPPAAAGEDLLDSG